MVDKVKAEELRTSGMTYKQIAKELSCSEAWCKKNLREVKVKHSRNVALDEFLSIIKNHGKISYEDICLLFYNKGSAEMSKQDKVTFKVLKMRLKRLINSEIKNKSEEKHYNVEIISLGGKFEVYCAYNISGELMYIGSGKLGRHIHVFSGKSHVSFFNGMNPDDIFVKVDQSFSNKIDSLMVESNLISTLFPPLNDRGNWKNKFLEL